MTVLIAGGGIGGLTLALSCQQLNIPFIIFEKTKTLEPLGVGINLQPNAVRELSDLNLKQDLYKIGVETQEFGLFSKKGLKIWAEPRGLAAGYNEPQFSVHRGQLQKLLYNKLIERADRFSIKTGYLVNSFENLTSVCCILNTGPNFDGFHPFVHDDHLLFRRARHFAQCW